MDNLKSLKECSEILNNKNSTVKEKYEVLFHLRSRNTVEAIDVLIKDYNTMDGSELLQHEIMYIMGQMGNPHAIDFLIKILNDTESAPVVRHEAGEALSNFPLRSKDILPHLKKYVNSDISVLKSTVNIAIRKLENYKNDNNYNKYLEGNIEPADPFSEKELQTYLKTNSVYKEDLLKVLLDFTVEEFIKYRIVYYLRNKEDEGACIILTHLLDKERGDLVSPLMRHEICFIIGQLNTKADFKFVKECLMKIVVDTDDNPIVRHEAVLTYNDIWGNKELIDIVKNDKNRLVAESVDIILD